MIAYTNKIMILAEKNIKMSVELKHDITFKIEGEVGKYNTLPIDILVKISQSFQELIFSLAKNDIPDDEPIDLNNFKIELSGFTSGSAVASYVYTQRIIPTIIDFNKQKQLVSDKLNVLLGIADRGSYSDLRNIYPEPLKRNEIVGKLYDFSNSFGNSPVSISNKSNPDKKYKIVKFKKEQKTELLGTVKEIQEDAEPELRLGLVKISKKGDKEKKYVQETYPIENHSLAYCLDEIDINNRKYVFRYTLISIIEKEDDYYIVKNSQLDIIGTGESELNAQKSFNEEFDYIFNRLNSLDDSKISKHLLRVKYILTDIVKEIVQ